VKSSYQQRCGCECEHDGRREGRVWGKCNGGKGGTRAREYVGGERIVEEEHTHMEPSEVI
jgi:hypothetical protein